MQTDIMMVQCVAESQGDLVIYHPQAADAEAPCAVKPGVAADDAYKNKLAKYKGLWLIPNGEFVPLAMETGGRMHPEFREFLRRYAMVKAGVDKYSEMTKEQRATSSANIRYLLTSISVAAARATGLSLLCIKDACEAVRVPGGSGAPPTQLATQGASQAGSSGAASTQALVGQGSGGAQPVGAALAAAGH